MPEEPALLSGGEESTGVLDQPPPGKEM